MEKLCRFAILISALVIIIVGVPSGKAFADGDEILGPPSITIESGTDVIAAGKGLSGGADGLSVPGTITFTVPSGATVKQALLYWEGNLKPSASPPVSDTINVDGSPVTGAFIGGIDHPDPTRDKHFVAYRADITSFVGTGANSLLISGLDFTGSNNGAGVLVIIDDGSGAASIEIRDGSDRAFIDALAPLDITNAQTFNFAPEAFARTSTLSMFFSDVIGELSGVAPNRPSSIEVTVGGTTTTFSNELGSLDGEEWDTVIKPILIPAGASSLTVQAFSRDDGVPGDPETGNLPASFTWITAALSIPPTPPEGCTPGYWKQEQHFDSWVGYSPGDYFEDVFERTITIKWSESGKPEPLSNPTLLQALEANGGGINALARHSVAALLNAANSNVSYSYTESEVIEMFQAAFDSSDFETTKDMFAEANEAGCPLNNAETEADSKANNKEKENKKVIVILYPEDADGITGKVIIKDNGKKTKVKGVAKNMDPDATYQTLIYTGTGCVGDSVLIGNWKVKRSGKGKLKVIFKPGLELDDFMSVSVREVTLGAPLLKGCGDF